MIEYVKRSPTSAAIGREDVGQDLAAEDRRRALAAGDRRLDEAAHGLLERRRADDARDERQLDERDAEHEHRLARARAGHEHEEEEERGKGEHDVGCAHQEGVDAASG